MGNANDDITFIKPQIVWDLNSAFPELFHRLAESDSWVKNAYQGLLHEVPATKSYRLFAKDGFIRLKKHARAFYMKGPDNQVFAIKGTEPTAVELEAKLQQMSKYYVSHVGSLVEAFVIKELKAPMALLESEAMQEAQKASEFQAAYLKHFGKLARVPVPLMVGRLGENIKSDYWKLLSLLLSERSREILDGLLKNDHLAVYIYYYPSVPTRASHSSPNLTGKDGMGYDERRKCHVSMNRLFHKDFEFFTVLDRWCELIVDMLELGYFPCSLSDYNSGHCVQRQNCVMDGGFVDVGSLSLMANVKEDYVFQDTFFMMTSCFSDAVERLFLGVVYEKPRQNMSITSLLHDCTLKEISAKIEQRIDRGIVFDARLVHLLNSMNSFRGLDSIFSNMYSPQHQDR